METADGQNDNRYQNQSDMPPEQIELSTLSRHCNDIEAKLNTVHSTPSPQKIGHDQKKRSIQYSNLWKE
jgi:hypothetical protein